MLLLVMAGGPGCVELYKMFFYENMDDGDKTVFALGFIQIVDDFKKLHDSEPNPEVWNFTLTCYRLMQCSQRTATEWIDDSQSVKLCRCEVDSSCNHELHKHLMIFFFFSLKSTECGVTLGVWTPLYVQGQRRAVSRLLAPPSCTPFRALLL